MENSITFTIAISAYKHNFLEDCLLSIINQKFKNFELIIINDFSPYKLEKIIEKFNDVRIIYKKNSENVGAENLVTNWNTCLKLASGNYFIMMGDDDTLDPEYLEEFLKLIVKYPNLDVYHCRSKIIDKNSEIVGFTPSLPEFESVYENIWHRIKGYRLQYISDFVYNTDALRKKGGFYNLPLAWASDDITSYLAIGSKGIAHTNRAIFNYRQSEFTISSNGNLELKMDAVIQEWKWLESFLISQPQDVNDKVIYEDLKCFYNKYIRNKKRSLIFQSIKKNPLTGLGKWTFKKKKFNLSYKDILCSLLGKF
jgi:glycosyltransferase involved in cell wall biosynthesis